LIREASYISHEKNNKNILYSIYYILSSFLGSTAQLRPCPLPQNPAEFLGGYSTLFFFIG
jgi:hypothetical protein